MGASLFARRALGRATGYRCYFIAMKDQNRWFRTVLPTPPRGGVGYPEGMNDHDTCSCHEPHVHGYNENKSKYLARLKRIEGQTRGIHRMIDEDQYCIDILTQVSAVTSALENVALALLQDHISHCVAGAAKEDGEAAEEKIAEAMKAIQKMVKS